MSIWGLPGETVPLKPSGFAILRGRGAGASPSDHIILPLEWQNESGKATLVRNPCLILHELDEKGVETGRDLRFPLAGEYPEISTDALKKSYVIRNSFVVDKQSISLRTLIFHNQRWWDASSDFYTLWFKSGERYRAKISFQTNNKENVEMDLFIMKIYKSTDNVSTDRKKAFWDFWYLDK